MATHEGRTATVSRMHRPRVLIVNAFFDLRRKAARPFSAIPVALGPIYLAGAFHPHHCRVRLYNEQYSGPLEDPALLGWPDMLVLTGLTIAFDRMRQLTAYARTLNPRVIVVAGGPAVRALPSLSAGVFDYACTGDVEQMREVVAEALGPVYLAEEMLPRFDLTREFGRIAYLEASRNCNFRCSFCALTGEGGRYERYDDASVRRQILAIREALGHIQLLTFLDNNFYGNDRRGFEARIEMLRELWHAGTFRFWTALVTNDFFLRPGNLELVREAGCMGLFSGVESFRTASLQRFNKRQNTARPQVELIRGCLDAGIVFAYGLILDLSTRTIEDCSDEIDTILAEPSIPLPSFVNLSIPLLGTPDFHAGIADGRFLPWTRLRDMDGMTLVTRPLDPLDRAAGFLRDLSTMRGRRGRVLAHSLAFLRRYRRRLGSEQLAIALSSAPRLTLPALASAPMRLGLNRSDSRRRTYVTTTEIEDYRYRPIFPVAAGFSDHFRPTMITDARGQLCEALIPDLGPGRSDEARAEKSIQDRA